MNAMDDCLLSQHEREILLDACLNDEVQDFFKEEYFLELLTKYGNNTDQNTIKNIAKKGVKQWGIVFLQTDSSNKVRINSNKINILSSILHHYCLIKLRKIKEVPEREVKYSILNNLKECYMINKKFNIPYPSSLSNEMDELDNIEKDLDSGKF